MEKIVTNELTHSVSRIISPEQHGFFRGRSVDTNLVTYTDFIFNAFEAGFQVDAVYTDFSKAFDKINHNLLLNKLLEIGVHGDLLRWIKSYIVNRSQAVALRGFISGFLPVSSGVPQGSHLGPLLFILYINDIGTCFSKSSHLVYADDTKIFRIIKSHNDCVELQEDLERFAAYCQSNQLLLNHDKCHIITFARKKQPLLFHYNFAGAFVHRVGRVRDLGVTLDAELSFNPHIDTITAKAFKRLGFILRLSKPFRLTHTLKILYFSFVRSILEFGCVVWNPQYKIHISRIEKVQSKVVKSLNYRSEQNQPSHSSFNRHILASLEKRRLYLDQIFLYKLLNNHIDSSTLLAKVKLRTPCRIPSRHLSTFHVSFCRSKYARNTFFRRACRDYNKKFMSLDIFSSSLPRYRDSLRNLLFSKN